MNLHSIVRGIINSVNSDEEVMLYHCTGTQNVLGKITPSYTISAINSQWQPAEKEVLQLVDATERKKTIRQVFLMSGVNSVARIPISVTGDYLYRNNEWWLVTNIPEDFSTSGWQCVLAVLQITPPKGVNV